MYSAFGNSLCTFKNFDTDNQIYVPQPKCTATFRMHCTWHDRRQHDLTWPILAGHETKQSEKDEGTSVEAGTDNKSPNP